MKNIGIACLCVLLFASGVGAVDYSDSANWLNKSGGGMPVDVFYLYPTARASGGDVICGIDDAGMRALAPLHYDGTATAFEPFANVYAPYYRQADSDVVLGMAPDDAEALVGGIPTADAVAAFEYYLEHHNNGRPFILAGHSQGSEVLLHLMGTYLKDHPEVRGRMVASYVVGYSVTEDYLADNPHLSFGTGEGDTGVILSWNTEAPGVSGSNPVVMDGAIVINPLTWSRGDEYAGIEYNLGSLSTGLGMPRGDILSGFASARIDPVRGVVVCDSVDPADYPMPPGAPFPAGSYHGSDYQFYYVNIMMNALLRSGVYLSREQAVMYPAAARALSDTARAFGRRLPSVFDADGERGGIASGGAFASPEIGGGITTFASTFGMRGSQDSEGRLYGYDLDGSGVSAGGFKTFGAFRLGFAAGYTAQHQRMHGFNGSADADTLHLSLFGGGRWGNVFLDAALGYSRAWNETERHTVFGGFADWKHTAEFGQDAWAGRLSVGYAGEIGFGLRLIPSVGADAMHIRTGAFDEGGAVTAIRMRRSRWNSVELPLSLRVDRTFRAGADAAVTPFVSGSWIPELNRNAPSARGSFVNTPSAGTFTATARVPSRSRGRVAAGIRADVGGRMTMSMEYSYDFARSHAMHEAAASFGLDF